MWLYFNEKGQLLVSLEHGNPARAGTTDFKIFAYFKDVDVSTSFSNATIKLRKPDLTGSGYPTLLMERSVQVFHLMSGETANSVSPFKDGDTYIGYLFDFSNFNTTEDEEVLLDTPGLWEATITLIGANRSLNVQGMATFNVQRGTTSDDETEIDIDTVLNRIYEELATKLNIASDFYVRVLSYENNKWYMGGAELETLTNDKFNVGDVVFEKVNKRFYKVTATGQAPEDGLEQIDLDLGEILNSVRDLDPEQTGWLKLSGGVVVLDNTVEEMNTIVTINSESSSISETDLTSLQANEHALILLNDEYYRLQKKDETNNLLTYASLDNNNLKAILINTNTLYWHLYNDKLSDYLPLNGGTMNGDIAMRENDITFHSRSSAQVYQNAVLNSSGLELERTNPRGGYSQKTYYTREYIKRSSTGLIQDETYYIYLPSKTGNLALAEDVVSLYNDESVYGHKTFENAVTFDSSVTVEQSGQLSLLFEPTSNQHAVNKGYVDEAIENIELQSDVIDVLGTYADLQDYDTSSVGLNDLIKVISDETHGNATSYYRWEEVGSVAQWVFVASEGPYYTQSEANARFVPYSGASQDLDLGSFGIKFEDNYGAASDFNASGLNFYQDNYGHNVQLLPPENISGMYDIYLPNESGTLATKGYVDTENAKDEKLANKVTSISSSSTDAEYPSAKAVQDAMDLKANKVGPLPKYSVAPTDNISTFLTTNVLRDTAFAFSLTNGRKFIANFGWTGSPVVSFEIEEVGSEKRYIGTQIPTATFTTLTFSDVLSSTYEDDFELAKNKVTTLSSSSTDTQYPSAKVVYDNVQNVREVAEGKCKTFVLSYDDTISYAKYIIQNTSSDTKFMVYNTSTKEFEDKTAELLNGDYDNVSTDNYKFNLQNNSIGTSGALIFRSISGLTRKPEVPNPSFWFVQSFYGFVLNKEAKVGDVVYVLEQSVPDRWVSDVDVTTTFSPLETQKVDLTNYYTKAEVDALLPTFANTGIYIED